LLSLTRDKPICCVHDVTRKILVGPLGAPGKIFWGSGPPWHPLAPPLVQGHMVVICIWGALFVTSQSDVIFMFPNQRFGEVCWHICIFFYIHSPYFRCHCTEYKLSAL